MSRRTARQVQVLPSVQQRMLEITCRWWQGSCVICDLNLECVSRSKAALLTFIALFSRVEYISPRNASD